MLYLAKAIQCPVQIRKLDIYLYRFYLPGISVLPVAMKAVRGLVPSDFLLFGCLKPQMIGKELDSPEDWIQEVSRVLWR
jgi:hypothetical protein